jgi:hypothetical protein
MDASFTEIEDLRAKLSAVEEENERMKKVLREACSEIEREAEGRGNGFKWWIAWLKRALAALPNNNPALRRH